MGLSITFFLVWRRTTRTRPFLYGKVSSALPSTHDPHGVLECTTITTSPGMKLLFCPFLQQWQILMDPSFPKEIRDVLDLFPSSPCIKILLIIKSWWEDRFTFHEYQMVWCQCFKIVRVLGQFCDGAIIEHCLSLTEHGMKPF